MPGTVEEVVREEQTLPQSEIEKRETVHADKKQKDEYAPTTEAGQALLLFMERYGPEAGEEGPVRLVREVFQAEPDEWQEEVLRAFGRGARRISIRSCHGVGKTCLLAWLVWCMLLTRFPMKTVATAPTQGQLFDGLFAEVLLWRNRLPKVIQEQFHYTARRIELKEEPESSFFVAKTARTEKPEALQGIHSKHVLIIADEASGVEDAIFEAGSGSMSDKHATTVMAGNPVRTSGLFFESHHRLSHMWQTWHLCAAPANWPHGIPSDRVAPEYVEEQAILYGEESNAYRIRVLGEFPAADDDAVIPYELIASAQNRDIKDHASDARIWGGDIARFGSARNALTVRTTRKVLEILTWEGVDLMRTVGKIKKKWDDTPPSQRPVQILIDEIGMGGGVVDRLREMGLPVRGINVGESSTIDDRFMRLRDELWWRTREWLEGKGVALPSSEPKGPKSPEALLAKELGEPRYSYTSSGKIQVESKDDMRKRKVPSPDLADSLIITFAGEAILAAGKSEMGGGHAWNESLPSRAGGIV